MTILGQLVANIEEQAVEPCSRLVKTAYCQMIEELNQDCNHFPIKGQSCYNQGAITSRYIEQGRRYAQECTILLQSCYNQCHGGDGGDREDAIYMEPMPPYKERRGSSFGNKM